VQQEIQQILKGDVTATDMLAYLSQQSVRLAELQQRPAIKTMSAEIPPPPADESLWGDADPTMRVTDVEMETLEQYSQQLMGIAAEGGDASSDFISAADSVLDRLKQEYGDPQLGSDMSGGIWDWMMAGEVSREAQETEEKWRQLISSLLANPKAGVEEVLMALGEYLTEKYGKGLTEAFKTFHAKQVAYEENMAKLDLAEGTPGAANMLKAQQEMQQYGMDTQMGMQTIQMFRQDIDRVQNYIKSTATAVHTTLSRMIQNIPPR
jgi:hypothetical protein